MTSSPSLLTAYLPVLLLLLATFLFAGVAAGSNAYQIDKNYDVSHLWETRERLCTLLGYTVLAFVGDMLQGRYWLAAGSMLLGAGAVACLFGLRFDVRLNLRRNLAWGYIGTDPQTAATDQQARRLGLSGQLYARLKLAALLLLCVALGLLRYPW